jgi:transposase
VIRRRNNVILTQKERKCLEAIVKSEKSSKFEKLKAQILLLTDISEYGPKLSYEDVATRLEVSSRSIGRIKDAYARNASIQDVFRFPGLSDQSNSSCGKKQTCSSSKKKNIQYVEIGNGEASSFLVEHIKCRVTLSKEDRATLESIINKGKYSHRKFNRAKILLLADEGPEGPAKSDIDIANELNVSKSTVERVRRLLLTERSLETVLNFNHGNAGRPRKIDGKVEATLVAQACSKPPEGRCKWTLRLLADRLVELEVVDSITHGSIGNALKKMNLSLGNERNG